MIFSLGGTPRSDRLFWGFMPFVAVTWPGATSRGHWRGGCPGIAFETRKLIREMARANFPSGAPRIHGELTLRIIVSQVVAHRPTRMIHPRTTSDSRPASPKPIDRSQMLGPAGRCATSGWADNPVPACNWTLWLARQRIQVSAARHGSAARPIRNSLGSFGL
jgi:hypothetical protein